MATKLRRSKGASEDPFDAAQTFVDRWSKQFALFTRTELKDCEAAVAAEFQARPTDRSVAAKFMLIATVLKYRSRSYKPSAIKRYFFLPGNMHACMQNFIDDKFEVTEDISDEALLTLIKTTKRSSSGNSKSKNRYRRSSVRH